MPTLTRLALLAFTLILGNSPPAQTLRLLKDLVPGTNSSWPYAFRDLRGSTVFVSGATPVSIWKTDGTAVGTKMLKALPADPKRVHVPWMERIGDKAFFFRNGKTYNDLAELWETDGTTAGTRRLGLVPGLTDANRFSFLKGVAVGPSQILFQGNYRANGTDIWRTDGTVKGTYLLRAKMGHAFAAGEIFLFNGTDAAHGSELWRTDGTRAGTRMVKDIWPGTPGRYGQYVAVAGEGGYFLANDGKGAALWKTDGTAKGTVPFFRVANIVANPRVAGKFVYITAGGRNGDLWAVDRTTGKGTLVATRAGIWESGPLGDGLWFSKGQQPWYTAGTVATTRQLSTQWISSFASAGWYRSAGSRYGFFPHGRGVAMLTSNPPGFRSMGALLRSVESIETVGGRLYRSGLDAAHGIELWTVDFGATSRPIGVGIGIDARTPTLAVSDPVLGSRMKIGIEGAYSGAALHLGISLGGATPIRFGQRAWYYLDPVLHVMVGGKVSGNAWNTTLQIPNTSSLKDLPVTFQALLLSTPARRGFELTNAAAARIGL